MKKRNANTTDSSKENTSRQPALPNQAMLFLRGFIGFYLIYLGGGLIKDESMVAPRMVVMVFAVIFILVGIGMVVWILRSWIRGEYVGGKADTTEEEEYTEYEEDFQEKDDNTLAIREESEKQDF